MKKILSILFVLTLVSLTVEKEKTVYQTKNLIGKISVLEESTYFVNELGEKSKILMNLSIYKFDSLGVIFEETIAPANGLGFKRIQYVNDPTGKPLQVEEYAKHGKLERKKTFKYDKNGNLIVAYVLKNDGKTIADKTVHKYDKKNNEIEFNKFGEDTTKMNGKSLNKYDGKNNLIESTIYIKDLKTPAGIAKYTYNNKGQKITEKGYDFKGTIRKHFEFNYDADGNMIELKSFKADGKTILLWTKSKFDDKHNETETLYLNPDGTIQETNTYEFTYDQKGNWIKQKRSTNGGLNQIIERKITYF